MNQSKADAIHAAFHAGQRAKLSRKPNRPPYSSYADPLLYAAWRKGWEETPELRGPQGNANPKVTRYLKCRCAMCGYTVRVVAKWLDQVGAPHCPVHGAMETRV